MLSVASVACFFTAYSPFQTTDVVQERRANVAKGAISPKICSQRQHARPSVHSDHEARRVAEPESP